MLAFTKRNGEHLKCQYLVQYIDQICRARLAIAGNGSRFPDSLSSAILSFDFEGMLGEVVIPS